MVFLSEKWNDNLIHCLGVDKIVALNIYKASDRVWHAVLLIKLEAFDVVSSFNKWISNSLSHRFIREAKDGVFLVTPKFESKTRTTFLGLTLSSLINFST